MKVTPCKNCIYRHIGCHATCFLYKEWKEQTLLVNEKMRKDSVINTALTYHKKTRKRY